MVGGAFQMLMGFRQVRWHLMRMDRRAVPLGTPQRGSQRRTWEIIPIPFHSICVLVSATAVLTRTTLRPFKNSIHFHVASQNPL